MGKNDITTKGLLHSYTEMSALIRAQASVPTFKGEVYRKKVISSQRIGGLNRGTHKTLKLTNKGCNYEQNIFKRGSKTQ